MSDSERERSRSRERRRSPSPVKNRDDHLDDEPRQEFKSFVGGISWDLDDAQLKELFEEFDAVDAKVMTDKYSGRSRGFGFVWFPSEASREAAIDKLHGHELSGRKISVTKAVPQSQTAPGTPAEALRRGETVSRDQGRIRRGGGRERDRDRGYHPYNGGGGYPRSRYEDRGYGSRYEDRGYGGGYGGYGGDRYGDRGYGGGYGAPPPERGYGSRGGYGEPPAYGDRPGGYGGGGYGAPPPFEPYVPAPYSAPPPAYDYPPRGGYGPPPNGGGYGDRYDRRPGGGYGDRGPGR